MTWSGCAAFVSNDDIRVQILNADQDSKCGPLQAILKTKVVALKIVAEMYYYIVSARKIFQHIILGTLVRKTSLFCEMTVTPPPPLILMGRSISVANARQRQY